MESWNNVINTALLGTEKRTLRKVDLDVVLSESVALVTEQTSDKEDSFLQTAALVYNQRQCGFLPLHKEAVTITQAAAEEKDYASLLAHAVLTDILETGSIALFRLWLNGCNDDQKIVQPELIPALLNAGVKTKSLQMLITTCCGKRGLWLQPFNGEWRWNQTDAGEDIWQTGNLLQRTAFLAAERKADPAKGRTLLQQTWAQEPAATKVELLEQLKINAGNEDVPWLEELLNEKSAKVKEAALTLLKVIPASGIIQQYWNILQQSIRLTTSKGLLGIGAKTSLEIKLVAVDPSIFKTGIQQLTSKANITDEHFIIYQLISSVPPDFWEGYFNMDSKKIMELFVKSEEHKSYVQAFGLAASRFKDLNWLRTVTLLDEINMYADVFGLLPQREAEEYALKFLFSDNGAESILHIINKFTGEWSLPFAKAVLCHTAKNPYHYHRGFYNELADHLPVSLTSELEDCIPKDTKDQYLRTTWSNTSEHISKLLTLKEQTQKVFNE